MALISYLNDPALLFEHWERQQATAAQAAITRSAATTLLAKHSLAILKVGTISNIFTPKVPILVDFMY